MRFLRLSTLLLVAMTAASARAQDDPEILYSSPFIWEWQYIGTALGQLGLGPHTTLLIANETELLTELRAQEWDLVIIRWYRPFALGQRDEIAAELEAHIQRGGKLMFSMAQIEQNRVLWDTLGIADTENLELPLPDIVAPRGGPFEPELRHPAHRQISRWGLGDEVFGPDYGDRLVPQAGSFPIALYDDGGAAIVVARDGRVIVSGQDWDNWSGFGIEVAEDQIRWLLSCPADLDGDGEATIFDFLEFQNLFDAGDPRADVFFDGRLDLFDFLEFFNQFEHACG